MGQEEEEEGAKIVPSQDNSYGLQERWPALDYFYFYLIFPML